MPEFLRNRKVQYLIIALTIFIILGTTFIVQHNIIAGIVAFVGLGLVIGILVSIDKSIRKQAESYVVSFSDNMDKTSKIALAELPIGAILYNDRNEIVWSNKFMKDVFKEKANMGGDIDDISERLTKILTKKVDCDTVAISDRLYKIENNEERKLAYLTDITKISNIEKKVDQTKPIIALIIVDNYDDVIQGMDDQASSVIKNVISSEMINWAAEHEIFLRRTASDKYFALLNEEILSRLEADKFSIIDNVRSATSKHGTMATLSIGIGKGNNSLVELGKLTQSGLDLALGRGGDQVVIKTDGEKPKFYGGTTNPTGKRARVRARVVAQALHDIIKTSQNVIVMGHMHPDVDVYGAGIGVLRIADSQNKNAYFVMDNNDFDISVSRLMEDVKENKELFAKFIYPEQALDIISENTLLVIVDTNKPSLVVSEKLLKKTSKIVVIDHHRRGESTIEQSMLSYIEPYASSASELITEIIEYHPTIKKIENIDATALLAGIMVDTKMFTNRTGARTFDAASYLRTYGADMRMVNKILKEDMNSIVERNKLIEHVYFYKEGYAITKGEESELTDRVIIAKAADALLSIDGVEASFVIGCSSNKDIVISSRSGGDVNVQLIMEKLNGGGHLSNAATQLKDVTILEAEIVLKQAIDEYIKERK